MQKANVQLCDAALIQDVKKPAMFAFALPQKHKAYADDAVISKALSTIIKHFFITYKEQIMKHKINEPIDFDTDDYQINFLKTHKRMWKVCFHIKTKEEDPS